MVHPRARRVKPCGRFQQCDQGIGHVGACYRDGELVNRTYQSDRFNLGETANPWAGTSPDCPQGHHARRVYLWSYDVDDRWPWYCADCRRRFNKSPVASPGRRAKTGSLPSKGSLRGGAGRG